MANFRKFQNLGNASLALAELQNDHNNAVAHIYSTPKQITQSGKLANATLTIKDVFATDDLPTQASSKLLENFQPSYNATVVEKLLNEGAIALAKVHNDELALGGTGTHSGFGLIVNPKDPQRFVGGSSSGSAATFTSNIGIALGSDTGDSVRLPGSYNGVPGFKPSYGAISRYGMFAYASSLDTVAYFAHNVNDLICISQSVFGKDEKDMTTVEVAIDNVTKTKPTKVIALDFSENVEEYVKVAFDNFVQKLQNEGVEVQIIKPNLTILKTIKPVYQIVSFSEASSNLSNLNGVAFGNRVNGDSWEEVMKQTRSLKFGKMVQERLSLGSYFLYQENQAEIFIKAQKARRVIKNYLTSLHEQADAVIYPAYGGVAPLFANPASYGVMDYILTGSNLVGNPSLTIPLATHQNLPFSLAIDAKIYEDAKLLGIAEYFEELIKGGK
ncbi:amidase family protein [Mycoplasmopsis glycophila]|uniref:Aspartyl/glutamyl-tRNA(Asn/Gln) amidotransferase subunit A n=1 Tax=Mycoplasmopsis glycophila TaxID=171285 RepID=A0A449AUZ4_9BACT|nr:amidase family protein [Mycoplasmopsis glycophila]VEU70290.1 aspartyl/glutamyl-tRNA(Asn/Gln) amidotransferase subunit A [Mycoplasmopsis glycophila]